MWKKGFIYLLLAPSYIAVASYVGILFGLSELYPDLSRPLSLVPVLSGPVLALIAFRLWPKDQKGRESRLRDMSMVVAVVCSLLAAFTLFGMWSWWDWGRRKTYRGERAEAMVTRMLPEYGLSREDFVEILGVANDGGKDPVYWYAFRIDPEQLPRIKDAFLSTSSPQDDSGIVEHSGGELFWLRSYLHPPEWCWPEEVVDMRVFELDHLAPDGTAVDGIYLGISEEAGIVFVQRWTL